LYKYRVTEKYIEIIIPNTFLHLLIHYAKESFRNFTKTHNTFSIEYSVQWSDFRAKKWRLPALELAEILKRHVLIISFIPYFLLTLVVCLVLQECVTKSLNFYRNMHKIVF